MTVAVVIWILLAILLGLLVVFWRRNNAVYAFRTCLIDEAYCLYTTEIEKVYELRLSGDGGARYPSDWRWREFDSISYEEMVWQPWRALDSFYRGGFPAVEEKP